MELLFEEKQKFNQWWLWIILLIFPILSIIPFNGNEINRYYVLIGLAIPSFFYFLELRTFVTKVGLHYQFFPFHFKKHLIRIEEIEKIEALQYKPIAEYGGWGIRCGFKGKAYNVTGNRGVKVHLKNGRNILFGSQKYKELENTLKQIKKQ